MTRLLIKVPAKFAYQKIENAESQQIEGDAHVTVIVEPIEHLNAQAMG